MAQESKKIVLLVVTGAEGPHCHIDPILASSVNVDVTDYEISTNVYHRIFDIFSKLIFETKKIFVT